MVEYNVVIDICRKSTDEDTNRFSYMTQYSDVQIQVNIARHLENHRGIHTYTHRIQSSGTFNITKIICNNTATNLVQPVNGVTNVIVYFEESSDDPALVLIVPSKPDGKYTYICKMNNKVWVNYQTINGKMVDGLVALIDAISKNKNKVRLDKLNGLKERFYITDSVIATYGLLSKSQIVDGDKAIGKSNGQTGDRPIVQGGYPNNNAWIICGIVNSLICMCVIAFGIYLVLSRHRAR